MCARKGYDSDGKWRKAAERQHFAQAPGPTALAKTHTTNHKCTRSAGTVKRRPPASRSKAFHQNVHDYVSSQPPTDFYNQQSLSRYVVTMLCMTLAIPHLAGCARLCKTLCFWMSERLSGEPKVSSIACIACTCPAPQQDCLWQSVTQVMWSRVAFSKTREAQEKNERSGGQNKGHAIGYLAMPANQISARGSVQEVRPLSS